MKFDFNKKKSIDPLITQKKFRNTSNAFDFSNKNKTVKVQTQTQTKLINDYENDINKHLRISKAIKKEFDELSFKIAENENGIINYNINGNDNLNYHHFNNNKLLARNKLSFSTVPFDTSFKITNTNHGLVSDIPNDHIPFHAIFRSTRNNTYFKFNKRK